MDRAVDGDIVLLHGLEQAGLGAWRGAVDFIAEQDIGEDGPSAERKVVSILRIHRDAGDVGGKEVGRELDAFEVGRDGSCDGLSEQGFAEAWDVLEQHVTSGDEGEHGMSDDLFLADEDFGDIGDETPGLIGWEHRG